jgi:hypothetical protein
MMDDEGIEWALAIRLFERRNLAVPQDLGPYPPQRLSLVVRLSSRAGISQVGTAARAEKVIWARPFRRS